MLPWQDEQNTPDLPLGDDQRGYGEANGQVLGPADSRIDDLIPTAAGTIDDSL
jgi:hypothetical protein